MRRTKAKVSKTEERHKDEVQPMVEMKQVRHRSHHDALQCCLLALHPSFLLWGPVSFKLERDFIFFRFGIAIPVGFFGVRHIGDAVVRRRARGAL